MKICLSVVAFLLLVACESAERDATSTAQHDITDSAVGQNMQDTIRSRQSHYKQIGAAMKGIGDELKKREPSVDVLQRQAVIIRDYAPKIEGWFPEGSGSGAGLKTEARDEIWSDSEGFRQSAQELIARSEQFHAITQTGDLAAIRAGVGDLGGTCKGCHDKYRAKQ
jgi:cytochrome c556